MELALLPSPTPLLSPPSPPLPFLLSPRRSRRRHPFRVRASSSDGPPFGLPWQRLSHSIRRGSHRFWLNFSSTLKKETGLDVEEANARLRELATSVRERVKPNEAEVVRLRSELLPAFLDWNRWERWKDLEHWDPKRIAALVLYTFVLVLSCQRAYVAIRAPALDRQRRQLTEAYMEALIPEPSPSNVRT